MKIFQLFVVMCSPAIAKRFTTVTPIESLLAGFISIVPPVACEAYKAAVPSVLSLL
jgi:hypothetical protein